MQDLKKENLDIYYLEKLKNFEKRITEDIEIEDDECRMMMYYTHWNTYSTLIKEMIRHYDKTDRIFCDRLKTQVKIDPFLGRELNTFEVATMLLKDADPKGSKKLLMSKRDRVKRLIYEFSIKSEGSMKRLIYLENEVESLQIKNKELRKENNELKEEIRLMRLKYEIKEDARTMAENIYNEVLKGSGYQTNKKKNIIAILTVLIDEGKPCDVDSLLLKTNIKSPETIRTHCEILEDNKIIEIDNVKEKLYYLYTFTEVLRFTEQ